MLDEEVINELQKRKKYNELMIKNINENKEENTIDKKGVKLTKIVGNITSLGTIFSSFLLSTSFPPASLVLLLFLPNISFFSQYITEKIYLKNNERKHLGIFTNKQKKIEIYKNNFKAEYDKERLNLDNKIIEKSIEMVKTKQNNYFNKISTDWQRKNIFDVMILNETIKNTSNMDNNIYSMKIADKMYTHNIILQLLGIIVNPSIFTFQFFSGYFLNAYATDYFAYKKIADGKACIYLKEEYDVIDEITKEKSSYLQSIVKAWYYLDDFDEMLRKEVLLTCNPNFKINNKEFFNDKNYDRLCDRLIEEEAVKEIEFATREVKHKNNKNEEIKEQKVKLERKRNDYIDNYYKIKEAIKNNDKQSVKILQIKR